MAGLLESPDLALPGVQGARAFEAFLWSHDGSMMPHLALQPRPKVLFDSLVPRKSRVSGYAWFGVPFVRLSGRFCVPQLEPEAAFHVVLGAKVRLVQYLLACHGGDMARCPA
jgi:hypothetical protein